MAKNTDECNNKIVLAFKNENKIRLFDTTSCMWNGVSGCIMYEWKPEYSQQW